MGLNVAALKAILHEHQFRPIHGNIAHIGKQTVMADDKTLLGLFLEYGIDSKALSKAFEMERDSDTRASMGHIHDHHLMRALGDCQYHCVDVSDYEGADIIHDMNQPIPEPFHGLFDYVYDGSCIDNVFDPVTFLRNVAKMLKPGGRTILVNHASGFPGAYIAPSAEWFFSYFALNGFSDCKVYVAKAVPAEDRNSAEYDLFAWNPYFTRNPHYDYFAACRDIETWLLTIVVAEKGPKSTAERTPIQSHYLTPDTPDWRAHTAAFDATPRPLMAGLKHPSVKDNLMLTDHHRYLGRI